jgi:hypothetical protein
MKTEPVQEMLERLRAQEHALAQQIEEATRQLLMTQGAIQALEHLLAEPEDKEHGG